MENLKRDKEITALLVIDPYNDFISEGGKLWDRIKSVAEANHCVPHMLRVLTAARQSGLRVFYAMHHRYRPGDYETWKYIAPIQKAAWSRKTFEFGTWSGEIRAEFAPQAGEIVAQGKRECRQSRGLLIRETRGRVFCHRDLVAKLSGKAHRRLHTCMCQKSDDDKLMNAMLLKLQIQISISKATGTPMLQGHDVAWLRCEFGADLATPRSLFDGLSRPSEIGRAHV